MTPAMHGRFEAQHTALCKRRDAAVEQLAASESVSASAARVLTGLKRRLAVEDAAARSGVLGGSDDGGGRGVPRSRGGARSRVDAAASIVRAVLAARDVGAPAATPGDTALAFAFVSRDSAAAPPYHAHAAAAVPRAPHGGGVRSASPAAVAHAYVPPVAGAVAPCDADRSPLLQFRAFRVHPTFAGTGLSRASVSFTNALDPSVPLCRFEARGVCNDPTCGWQHARQYAVGEREACAQLRVYAPGASVAAPAAAPALPGAVEDGGGPSEPLEQLCPGVDAVAGAVWADLAARGLGVAGAAAAGGAHRRAVKHGSASEVHVAAGMSTWAPRWLAAVYDAVEAAPPAGSGGGAGGGSGSTTEWMDSVPVSRAPGFRDTVGGGTWMRDAEALIDVQAASRLGLRAAYGASGCADAPRRRNAEGLVSSRAGAAAVATAAVAVSPVDAPTSKASAHRASSEAVAFAPAGDVTSADADAPMSAPPAIAAPHDIEFMALHPVASEAPRGGGDEAASEGSASELSDEDEAARYYDAPPPPDDAPMRGVANAAPALADGAAAAAGGPAAAAPMEIEAAGLVEGAWLAAAVRALSDGARPDEVLATLAASPRPLSAPQSARAGRVLRGVSLSLDAPEHRGCGAGWALLLRLHGCRTPDRLRAVECAHVAAHAVRCAPGSAAVWDAAASAYLAADLGTHEYAGLLQDALAAVFAAAPRPVPVATSWFLVACLVRWAACMWLAGHRGAALAGLESRLRAHLCVDECSGSHACFGGGASGGGAVATRDDSAAAASAVGGGGGVFALDPAAMCLVWQFYVCIAAWGELPGEDALADCAFALRYAPESASFHRLSAARRAAAAESGRGAAAATCALSAWWRWALALPPGAAADTHLAALGCTWVDLELPRLELVPAAGAPAADVPFLLSPFVDASRAAGRWTQSVRRRVLMAALDGLTAAVPAPVAEAVASSVTNLAESDGDRSFLRLSVAAAAALAGRAERAVEALAHARAAEQRDEDPEAAAVHAVCAEVATVLSSRAGARAQHVSVVLDRGLGALLTRARGSERGAWPMWLRERVWRLRAAMRAQVTTAAGRQAGGGGGGAGGGGARSGASCARIAGFVQRCVRDLVAAAGVAWAGSAEPRGAASPDAALESYFLELSHLSFGPPTFSATIGALMRAVRACARPALDVV